MKLVKINIAFKCPMDDCMAGEDTNGVECLRCVLINVMGDQQMWEEVQANKPRGEGDERVIDISQNEIPDITPEMTEKDLKFLGSPAHILMGQKEWGGPALEKAVDLYNSSSHFRRGPPVIELVPLAPQLEDSDHDPEDGP